ncbi:hypothetical protein FQN54_002014 [Arachnomyces sp. PD_36]|nr:hypothetical protein FQN54_002014 [Arachnomyces sp. PD_36]
MADDAVGTSSHAPCADTPQPGVDAALYPPPTGLDASGFPFGYDTFGNNANASDSDSGTGVGDRSDWIAAVIFFLILLFIAVMAFGSFGSIGTSI